jgi:serine protease Do
MSRKTKYLVGYLALVLATGAVFTILSSAFISDGHHAAAQTADISQARAMADQFSELFEAAAKEVSPSVVPIFAEQVVTASNPFAGSNNQLQQLFGEDFFHHFFQAPFSGGQMRQTIRSLGSGVIVSDDGYILTNNHVIAGAEKLTVITQDGNKHTAKVIGADPQTDVAVIKIEGDHLPTATLGDSDEVKVGQWVIAVGNPFQLLHSVTAGIISAKGRSSIGLADYEDFIQTDASINPGNSGGALADLDGNVIAINTAISSPSGASAGVGFAIPMKMAQNVMNALIEYGKVSRGYLALVPQDIDETMAKAMNLKSREGALVGDVVKDGPADKAGVKRGDVIVKFDGKKIENSTELRNDVAETPPGKKIEMTLLRNGKTEHVDVKLAERPTTQGRGTTEQQPAEPGKYQQLGLQIQDLTPAIAQQLGYGNAQGVVVSNVAAGSPAEDAGFQRGDLIREVDHKQVTTVKEFDRALSQSKKEGAALFLVQRGQVTFFVAIKLP